MPAFDTPQPITLTVEVGVGTVSIAASDRADTVVEVRPTDPTDPSDVKVADQTTVEFADGAVRVVAPRVRGLDFSRRSRSVEVSVELPSGSRVQADTQVGDVRSAGVLGECRVKTGVGRVHLADTGPLRLSTGAGHVTVGRVDGSAEVSTGSGRVRIQELEGPATVKSSNGDVEIGSARGDARVRSANGDITVGVVAGDVDAKTSHGSIRLVEAVDGTIVLKTGHGDIEIGVGEGTAAWVDLHTGFGRVRNALSEAGAAPTTAASTAEIHARTSFGDVSVRRT